MEEEDKEFFVLVLGVLAAIILVISWWYTTGGTATTQPVVEDASVEVDEDHSDDDDDDDDESGDVALLPDDEPATPEPVEEAPAEDQVPALPTNVVEIMAANPNLSVISDLLAQERLDQALLADGPFTVLAPSNDAITNAAASDTTLSVLETSRTEVLAYHVILGSFTPDELIDLARGSRSAEIITLQGEPLNLSLDGTNVIINGATMIVGDPELSDNGNVYTIDNVLVPPVTALNTLVGLDPILFATGSAEIQPGSFATLDQFIEVLQGTGVNVSIEGHTDNTGDPVLNQTLSQNRARSVLNYLVANGIDESRLTATGFGPSNPIADNESDEGRALNRRIEFALDAS